MRIVHVSDGWGRTNGVANVARLIADEQVSKGYAVAFRRWAKIGELKAADEVWIHCGWMPCLWWAALWAKKAVWMPHGSFDPFRLRYHGWKKWLVGPIGRWALRRCTSIKATCVAEVEWVRAYEPQVKAVEILDVKKYFGVGAGEGVGVGKGNLHVLYLGRRHPLKGVEYLERTVREIGDGVELRIVSNALGEEKEKVWAWCDVLCLPTLSENFGLVVAEALERGKRVVVTDGAPAWNPDGGAETVGRGYGGRLVYLRGYRDGDERTRVELLKAGLETCRTV